MDGFVATFSGLLATIAGNPDPGFADGQGIEARFCYPNRFTADHGGNIVPAEK